MKLTYRTNNGFTLIELMVAISIFAIVSLLTMGGLSFVLNTEQHAEEKMQQLNRLQMILTIMSRELQQAVLRPVRDEYGAEIAFMSNRTSEGIQGIEFAHQGRFTLGHSTSVQRVAYYLEDEQLVKKIWPVLDRVEDSKAVKQILIDNVEGLKFEFFSGASPEQSHNAIWQSDLDETQKIPLRGVKVSLMIPDYGEVRRIFEIAQ